MITQYKIFIFSEDPDKLVKFYTDVLDFKIIKKLEYELDYGYTIQIPKGDMQIWLAKHSDVRGENKDPYRHLVNFYTDNLDHYLEKSRSYPGVRVIAEPFCMGEIIPGEERWACTILDPEGNCLQFMGSRQHVSKR